MNIDDREVRWGYLSKICSYCKHWKRGKFSKKEVPKGFTDFLCSAFPNGIPEIIWIGKDNHTKPFKGDGGIIFELREKDIIKGGENGD